MSREEAIKMLQTEKECVERQDTPKCNRLCLECDLCMPTEKVIEGYDIAIKALEHPEKNVVAIVPHGDTISRQAVIDAMYELCDTGENLKDNPWRYNPHIDAIIDAINELPGAEKTELNPSYNRIKTELKDGDCISKQAVDDIFQKAINSDSINLKEDWKKLIWVREHIKELPSVVREKRTGQWIEHFDESGKWYECDQCHTDWGGSVNYCPNCGCRMEGGAE